MFASQLLRVLQTFPSDVKYKICYDSVSVSSEQDMTMKENPNPTLSDSIFVSKEIYPLNGLRSETGPLVSDEKDWKPKFADEFSTNNYGPLYPPSNRKDKMPMASFIASERKDTKYFYTNRNILDRDKPELMVCYEGVNYHVVKDICIDEGTSLSGKILTGNSKDDQSCNCLDGSDASSSSFAEGSSANELKISKSPSESPSDETLSDDDSAEDSFIDKTLPIQEFGTRSFLRSLIDSLDGDERHKEISSGKVISVGPTESVAEAESKEDIQAINNLSYNSKLVESQIITFNFNSPTLEPPGVITDGITKKANERSVDSTNAITEKVNEHSVDSTIESGQSVHCNSSENTSIENVNDDRLLPDHEYDGSHDADSAHVLGVNNESVVSREKYEHVLRVNNDHEYDGSHDAESAHVLRVNNESVVSREKYEQGDSSFSAASGFVVHSGPIPFSGSDSFRSDVSATSGRSFAFPILQSEWNSSPVRMTKTNEGRFRKHKCWRSGLLCCRF